MSCTAHDSSRLSAIIAFLQAAEKLKGTLRSGASSGGRAESSAEHSWRLSLFVLLFERELEGVDMLRLLKLVIVHDLGEAISGDVPAIRQGAGEGQVSSSDKAARERADFAALCAPLPEDLSAEMLSLFGEYEAAASPEAVLAKGFDKLETIFQHALGQAPGFDYAFNLTYGREATARHPLLAELRKFADDATRARMEEARGEGEAGEP